MSMAADIVDEREHTHGSFSASAAIAQGLKGVMSLAPNTAELDHVKAEALDLMATKIARILCGEAEEIDHWTDFGGYAELVVRDIRERRAGHAAADPL